MINIPVKYQISEVKEEILSLLYEYNLYIHVLWLTQHPLKDASKQEIQDDAWEGMGLREKPHDMQVV